MIRDIVAQMVTQLETALATSDYEVTVFAGMLPDPSMTTIDIWGGDPFRSEEAAAQGDISGAYEFIVRARTGLNDFDAAQWILFDLMDDESDICIGHILGDDPTLNGWAQYVYVRPPSGFRPYQVPEGTMAGVEWPVTVLAATS